MANYGTEAGVAALCRQFADPTTALFTTATNPTLVTVTSWLSQITSMFNIALKSGGFVAPITDVDITPALDAFVNQMAADLVKEANFSGRFYTDRALENGVSSMIIINRDVRAWVQANSDGLTASAVAIDTDANTSVYAERGDVWPDNRQLPENRFYYGGLG